ncbi:SDR family NAD(P)-dependent oxidoreductase [Kumtagia ephedrae]|uniref:Cyclopentanol dehydrogenase n=1 Tax=Kumtagia ephedrae TaxID=2116701 RepID=A0A2P7SS35_9HYPH|nr:glucose 1-dehydrogenase [Mesorhizobium ephedrae]PSJ65289.1 cyclopentanol dehydrogenase [Mesorhizobium ephedrae]
MRLAGKVAIITGAASGLGAATAKRFIEEGAKVCVADRLEEEGRAIARSLGDAAIFRTLDVTDGRQWAEVVQAVVTAFGRLDILVNNAGIGPGTTEIFDDTAWERQADINGKGPFLGIKSAVPHMRGTGGGAIVNISSISAKVGMGLHLGYGASKGAVLGMSKTAAVMFARDDIRVNVVMPGVMPPMRNSTAKADPATRQRMLDGIPMGRTGEVEDIANAVLFLASDEARYITGVEIAVDGGYLAR